MADEHRKEFQPAPPSQQGQVAITNDIVQALHNLDLATDRTLFTNRLIKVCADLASTTNATPIIKDYFRVTWGKQSEKEEAGKRKIDALIDREDYPAVVFECRAQVEAIIKSGSTKTLSGALLKAVGPVRQPLAPNPFPVYPILQSVRVSFVVGNQTGTLFEASAKQR